jgi:hypothetical protein
VLRIIDMKSLGKSKSPFHEHTQERENPLLSYIALIEKVLERNQQLEAALQRVPRVEVGPKSLRNVFQIYMRDKDCPLSESGCTCSKVYINAKIGHYICKQYERCTGLAFPCMASALKSIEKEGVDVGKLYEYLPHTICKLHKIMDKPTLSMEEMDAVFLVMEISKHIRNKYNV